MIIEVVTGRGHYHWVLPPIDFAPAISVRAEPKARTRANRGRTLRGVIVELGDQSVGGETPRTQYAVIRAGDHHGQVRVELRRGVPRDRGGRGIYHQCGGRQAKPRKREEERKSRRVEKSANSTLILAEKQVKLCRQIFGTEDKLKNDELRGYSATCFVARD